jgi:hypothetical protein
MMTADQRKLYYEIRAHLAGLGFDANEPDMIERPSDDPVLGSAVLTDEEAGSLLPFARRALQLQVPVALLPGDEEPFIRLDFDFTGVL